MSGLLHHAFSSLTPSGVTDGFLLLMLFIFGVGLALRFTGRGSDFVEQAPGFLTSLGILGTFIGIIIGLYGFSLEDIDGSIADLMAGLKTAFITSVIGLALSLLLRVFSRMLRLPSDPVQEIATIDDLNQNLLEMRSALEGFAQRTGEELVERLEQVVGNFNLQVQAQFGDNLQQFCRQLSGLEPALSAAAREYEAHADRVASWGQRCEESQQRLSDQQSVISQMFDKIAGLPSVYQGMDQLLNRQGEQADQLASLMRAQTESTQRLAELVPQLPENMERLSQGIVTAQKGVDENLAAINGLLQDQARSLADRFQQLSGTLDSLRGLDTDALQNLVNASAQSHRESMRELAQLLATTHREMLQALTEVVRRELKDTDVSIRRQYEQMDRVMAVQVEQVMAAMGEALATISGNFTRDYQKLLTQMRRLQVREAEYAD